MKFGWLYAMLLVLPFPFIFASETPKQLLVGVGGYNTCYKSSVTSKPSPYGMGIANSFLELASHNANSEYIMGCLFTAPPPSGAMVFVTSREPKRLIYGNSDWLRDTIRARIKEDPELQITLIGHSYGGWLSMYLAEDLKKEIRFSAIFTLDPISPKGCGPLGVVFGVKGCHEAPTDLDNKAVRETTNLWENFYQRQDTFLRSSAIKEAKNTLLTYWGAHVDVGADMRVWDNVQTYMTSH